MDRLADAALADPANARLLAGRRAGVYRIDRVELIGNTVVLYTDNSWGEHAFVRAPGAKSDNIHGLPSEDKDDPRFYKDLPKGPNGRTDDREARRIRGDWFVLYSVYWLIKDGWS